MKKMIFGNNTPPGTPANQPEFKARYGAPPVMHSGFPKQGYLYIPFAAEDMIHQSLGLNLIRHLKGKSLYPLIVPNQKIRNEIMELRAAEINNLVTQINTVSDKLQEVDAGLQVHEDWNGETLRKALSPDIFDKFTASIARLSQQLVVLKNTNFTHIPLSQLSATTDKLYILGHGTAGADVLAADEAATLGLMTAATLAEQLHSCGLPKTFEDIRITACYSADSFKPTSFAAVELEASSGAKRKGIIGKFISLKGTQPLAQTISRELQRLGYNSIQVTGYHGAGVTYSQTEFRTRRIPGAPDIRRSLVSHTFR